MVAHFRDSHKTVNAEKQRVSFLILAALLDDKISQVRDIELHCYLDAVEIAATDTVAYSIITGIENKINCWRCGGEGKVLLYDGYDAGDYFVPTDSEMCCCPVCGG